MKTKLKWQQIGGLWYVDNPLFGGWACNTFSDGTEHCFSIYIGDPINYDAEPQIFDSLEAAQLEVERRIREAAMPLFAGVIAERDAALARVAEMEKKLAAAWTNGHDYVKVQAHSRIEELKARVGELESQSSAPSNTSDCLQEIHRHVAELCKMTGTMLPNEAPDSWTLANCVRRLKARVAELEAGGDDELTAAWMAGRESAKDEVAALKAELNGLRALCNEAVTFAELTGLIFPLRLVERLKAIPESSPAPAETEAELAAETERQNANAAERLAELEDAERAVANLEEWKARAMKVLEKASLPRHYFQPERFGGNGCGFCGNDLRHLTHYRMGESTKSDRDDARSLIDAARREAGAKDNG